MKRLDEIVQALIEGVGDKNFSDFSLNGSALHFKYAGGKFVAFKSVTSDLKTGELTFYHATPFDGGQRIIEVQGFLIRSAQYSAAITNTFEERDHRLRGSDFQDGLAIVFEDREIGSVFQLQFVNKLIKDNFRIYLS